MMGSEFYFRDKIPVAILGATGCVGQKMVQMLMDHPWFQIIALCASERSCGRPYAEAAHWLMPVSLPDWIARMKVVPCEPNLPCPLVFSALDASVAGTLETSFAEAGYLVVSNSRSHRLDPLVPLLVAEVNPEQLELLPHQPFPKGKIITNPNCSVIGLVMALKPLIKEFGLEAVQVTTMQAVSGAGYPGVASLDILDNMIPFIPGEEEKVEREPLKVLGAWEEGAWKEASFVVSAQCNRVSVTDGHMACASIKLKNSPSNKEDIIKAWTSFSALPQEWRLPTAPEQPLHYYWHETHPQPRLHRLVDKGMAVSVGRLRPCSIMGYKFSILSHNTIRGAAGAAILNAELMVKKGLVYW